MLKIVNLNGSLVGTINLNKDNILEYSNLIYLINKLYKSNQISLFINNNKIIGTNYEYNNFNIFKTFYYFQQKNRIKLETDIITIVNINFSEKDIFDFNKYPKDYIDNKFLLYFRLDIINELNYTKKDLQSIYNNIQNQQMINEMIDYDIYYNIYICKSVNVNDKTH